MKIVILEPLGVQEEYLKKLLAPIAIKHEIVYYSDRKEDAKSLIDRAEDADIVVLTNFPFTREVMEHCPKLKYICVAFTGYNHIDMDYCREKGIVVSNCAGYSTDAVAELVFGLVFDLYRHISEYNEKTRNKETKGNLVLHEIKGKKFGIIGMGTIGQRVATIADAFGADVYYWSRNRKNLPYQYLELDDVLKNCDIISIHLAQNSDTVGLISKERIALMKKNAILINTARGPIVDSEALANALNEGLIAGAGIDVYETEPPIINHPLLSCKNTILLPHIGFYTEEALEKRAIIVKDNLEGYLHDQLINVVS